MLRRAWFSALPCLVALAACSSPTADGALKFVYVDDPFAGPPAATKVDVDAIDATSGAVTSLATGAALTSATIDLGSMSNDAVVSIRARAKDDAGDVVAWGETIPLQAAALADATAPLFIQRTNAMARWPGAMSKVRAAPLLQIVSGEYVMIAGGGDAPTATLAELYDFGAWGPLASPPTLARAPLSLAVAGLAALAIDATGASWLDLTASTSTDATLPAGGAWADVAGGATITATDGTAYVVGATRATGAPTSAVLVATSDGALSFARLTAPRLGAAAAWVDGRGLVVAGGSATAAGIEVLAEGATSASALPYPPDATTGGGADVLDASHVVLAGGASAPAPRVADLSCSASCAPATWSMKPAVDLPIAQCFSTGATSALVVGEDATGATHAFAIGPNLAQEIAFKVPRNHARALRLPTGVIAIAGGDATIESFAF